MRTSPLSGATPGGITPGRTGVVHPSSGQLVDHAQVVVELEEELGDPEVGGRQLDRQVAAVPDPVAVRAGVQLGVGGHADREVAGMVPDQLHQFERVGEVAARVAAVGGRVTGERQDVADAAGLVLVEQRHDLVTGWPTQVRWAIAGNTCSRFTCITMSRVRSRVEPPAP